MGTPVVGYRRTEVGSAPVSDFKEICTAVQYSTLSEKLEYLFFSPRTFQCYFMNIHNKYLGKIFSALCVDVFTELFRIFPNFDISWYMTKYSEVHLKNCLLIKYCSISKVMYSLVGLLDRVLASYTGGPWIKSWEDPFFQYRDKTSEYSEIYREQSTSEHFLPYNYRSSTLPRISRNIGWLLRQCACSGPWSQITHSAACSDKQHDYR
jgi:hypothetical protein